MKKSNEYPKVVLFLWNINDTGKEKFGRNNYNELEEDYEREGDVEGLGETPEEHFHLSWIARIISKSLKNGTANHYSKTASIIHIKNR